MSIHQQSVYYSGESVVLPVESPASFISPVSGTCVKMTGSIYLRHGNQSAQRLYALETYRVRKRCAAIKRQRGADGPCADAWTRNIERVRARAGKLICNLKRDFGCLRYQICHAVVYVEHHWRGRTLRRQLHGERRLRVGAK